MKSIRVLLVLLFGKLFTFIVQQWSMMIRCKCFAGCPGGGVGLFTDVGRWWLQFGSDSLVRWSTCGLFDEVQRGKTRSSYKSVCLEVCWSYDPLWILAHAWTDGSVLTPGWLHTLKIMVASSPPNWGSSCSVSSTVLKDLAHGPQKIFVTQWWLFTKKY